MDQLLLNESQQLTVNTQLRPCYVVVRKLTFDEISRININPFQVKYRCGRCNTIIYNGPKCASCKTIYHFDCAILSQKCCSKYILPSSQNLVKSTCVRCCKAVQFGPQCSLCKSMFHNFCLDAFDRCCNMPILIRNFQRKCGWCQNFVQLGPKCPLCSITYHVSCLKDKKLLCCGVQINADSTNLDFSCFKCAKKVTFASPYCVYCGNLCHSSCLNIISSKCCGKEINIDVFFITNFDCIDKIFNINCQLIQVKKIAAVKTPISGNVKSGSKKRLSIKDTPAPKRTYNKSKAQTKTRNKEIVEKPGIAPSERNPVNDTHLVSCKIEVEEIEEYDHADQSVMELDEPPLLIREEPIQDPMPSTSTSIQKPHQNDNNEDDDTLEGLFHFLYNVVKKFPPALKTQVKFELFKTVNDAEMKLNSNNSA